MRILPIIILVALAACQPGVPDEKLRAISMDSFSHALSALLTDKTINPRENAVLRRGFELAASRGGNKELIDSPGERKELASIISASTGNASARERLLRSLDLQ